MHTGSSFLSAITGLESVTQKHKIDNIGQFWSEKPGLELHYTPVQAHVCPLLSTVR